MENVGVNVRIAYAMLTAESRDVDLGKVTYDFLNGEDADDYIDTLARIGQTRIALYQIAEMLKLSVMRQWSAVNGALIASGEEPIEVSDDISCDDELLALRPVFEAQCKIFKTETEKVADAEQQYPIKHPRDPRLAIVSDAQRKAIDADKRLVEKVTSLRARTKEGIRFKREVRAYWEDCEQPELEASIFADLLAYVEASP